MMIYIFWDINEFNAEIPVLYEIPESFFDKHLDKEIDEVVSVFLENLKTGLRIKFWGEVVDVIRNIMNLIDNKRDLVEIQNNLFKDIMTNRYLKIEIISQILDIMIATNKILIDELGILYKIGDNNEKQEEQEYQLC